MYSFDTIFSIGLLLCITGSSRHLHLESFESSIHLHPSNLDHLSILIINTRSGSSLNLDHHGTSSLDLDHHWASSLDLDHHCWIIIIGSGSSRGHHHRCYLMILLIIGTSIELVLFHTGCIILELVLFHTRWGITELVLFHTRCGIHFRASPFSN